MFEAGCLRSSSRRRIPIVQQVRRKVDAISRGKDQLIRLCGMSIFRQNVTAAMCDCNFMLIMSFLHKKSIFSNIIYSYNGRKFSCAWKILRKFNLKKIHVNLKILESDFADSWRDSSVRIRTRRSVLSLLTRNRVKLLCAGDNHAAENSTSHLFCR